MEPSGIWTLVAIDWTVGERTDSLLAGRLFEDSEHLKAVIRTALPGVSLLAYRSARAAIKDALKVIDACDAKIAILSVETANVETAGFSLLSGRLHGILKLMGLGAVVCTLSTYELCRYGSEGELLFFDLGSATLPAVGGRERLFQITPASYPSHPITIDRNERVLDTLPGGYGYFAGRKPELDLAMLNLENSRSVTVTGIPGLGKTHFSIRAAREAKENYSAGVAFVPLNGVNSESGVFARLAKGLDLEGEFATAEVVARVLQQERVLVVLDGAEHCAEIVQRLYLSRFRAGAARFLFTSIQPLGYEGEVVVSLPPMSVPPENIELTPDDLYDFEATALFMDRISDLHENVEAWIDPNAVAELTRRLGGHPYAICLAAGQTRFKSVEAILETADGLTGKVAYRKSIQASVKGLPVLARQAATALSVCESPITVRQLSRFISEADAATALDDLKRSGLIAEELAPSGRVVYSLFPSIRSELLRSGGTVVRKLQDVRDKVFLELMRDATAGHALSPRSGDLDMAEEHEADIFEALTSVAERRPAEEFYDAIIGSWAYFYDRNRFDDHYLRLIAGSAWRCAQFEPAVSADLFNIAGVLSTKAGRIEPAQSYFDAGLNIAEKADDRLRTAKILHNYAAVWRGAGRLDLAIEQDTTAAEIFSGFEARQWQAFAVLALANYYAEFGNPERAQEARRQAIEIYPLSSNLDYWSDAITRAMISWANKDFHRGREFAAESVKLAGAVGDRVYVIRSLAWLAQILSDGGESTLAAHVLAITAPDPRDQGVLLPINVKRLKEIESTLRHRLGDKWLNSELVAGSAQSLEEVLASIC